MATKTVEDLRKRTDASWANLTKQLPGLEPHLERSDKPGEWTAREVLSHLLFAPGVDFVARLRTFSTGTLPVVEITPGQTHLTPERKKMTLKQLTDALAAQRAGVFAYLDTLSEADMARMARIPLFKQFMGTDEITIPVYVGAMYEFHWGDHTGQLAKIRKAAGLSDAKQHVRSGKAAARPRGGTGSARASRDRGRRRAPGGRAR